MDFSDTFRHIVQGEGPCIWLVLGGVGFMNSAVVKTRPNSYTGGCSIKWKILDIVLGNLAK